MIVDLEREMVVLYHKATRCKVGRGEAQGEGAPRGAMWGRRL